MTHKISAIAELLTPLFIPLNVLLDKFLETITVSTIIEYKNIIEYSCPVFTIYKPKLLYNQIINTLLAVSFFYLKAYKIIAFWYFSDYET